MSYIHFIGIDVSKEWFDVAWYDQAAKPQRFQNGREGFAAFCEMFAAQLPQAFVVLEATGRYEQALLHHLLRAGVAVHRASGLQTACFARSLRPHGKTDRTDAEALACYAKERHAGLALAIVPEESLERLDALLAHRNDLLAMKVAQQQRVRHPRYALCRDKLQKVLEFIGEELADTQDAIDALIARDTHKRQAMQVMQTVPGVGKQTALTLLAAMPELGSLSRREAASLAGVAPHPKESGKIRSYRATRGGRKIVKKAAFLAALSASRSKTPLGDFYRKLIQNGKKPMLALTALARKIITILNARLKEHYLMLAQSSW